MRRPKTNVKKYNFKLYGQTEIVSIEAGSLSTALNRLSTEENTGLHIERATCTGRSGESGGYVVYDELKGLELLAREKKVKPLKSTEEFSFVDSVEEECKANKNQYND